MKSWLYITGVLFLCLALTEMALRVYGHFKPIYHVEMSRYANEFKRVSENVHIAHEHWPGRSARLMGVDFHTNSDGLRDDEYNLAVTEKRRLVFLGDSLTMGWGVEKAASFEALLEQTLNQRQPTEVINFSHGNYNAAQEVHLLSAKGLAYRPQGVVLFYFINDAEMTPRRTEWGLLANSWLLTVYWSLLKRMGDEYRDYQSYYRSLYQPDASGWKATQQAIGLFAQICREQQMWCRAVLLPELHQARPYPFAREHALVQSEFSAQGIVWRDLSDLFSEVTDLRTLWVAPDDAHPNALAHAKIAEALVNFLTEAVR